MLFGSDGASRIALNRYKTSLVETKHFVQTSTAILFLLYIFDCGIDKQIDPKAFPLNRQEDICYKGGPVEELIQWSPIPSLFDKGFKNEIGRIERLPQAHSHPTTTTRTPASNNYRKWCHLLKYIWVMLYWISIGLRIVTRIIIGVQECIYGLFLKIRHSFLTSPGC